MVGRDLKKLDVLLHRHIPSNPEDAKARAALQNLVETHRSLAEAVQTAMEAGGAFNMDLEELREGMNAFLAELKQYSKRAEVATESILQDEGAGHTLGVRDHTSPTPHPPATTTTRCNGHSTCSCGVIWY